MRLALILITAVFQVMSDLEICEIFPRNPFVPYGSNLTFFLRAPSGSSCRSLMMFEHSRIYWTLNKRKIDERFYDFNSTFLSVSVHNLSVKAGTVECFLNSTTPVLLHGTFIRTYPFLSKPQNVSCMLKIHFLNVLYHGISCTWDHDQYSKDINYIVHLKQDKEHICKTQERSCTFPKNVYAILSSQLTVSVRAENSYGDSTQSSEVTYNKAMAIVQIDAPEDIIAEPLPTGLMVTWKNDQTELFLLEEKECEIRSHEKGSGDKTEHFLLNGCSGKEVVKVKPCTNYTVSVRSRYRDTVWSPWSYGVTAVSYLNVSSLPFHLWRSKSVLGDQRKRTVHLMWKGVPPSCQALDKYCIISNSVRLLKCVAPYQDHTFITLDERPHSITVAAFRNEISLNEASIEVPAMAEEVSLPPVGNMSVFVHHGGIHITWTKPSLPVSGYIIVWNSTAKNHMWNQSLKTSFTLNGEPSTFYTITVTPLYKEGPGNENTVHNCSQERTLMDVSKVQVTVVNENSAEIHWMPVLPSQSCAFVLNYTVIYQNIKGQNTKNVTVESNQHNVTLKNLQAKTSYRVFVMANTVAASSTSVPIIFSTKSKSQIFLIVIIACCLCLIVLPILFVMILRKVLSKRIPDPRFSSLSMWPSDKCRKPWSLLSVPGDRDTDKIWPCHVDSEIVSVSPTSIKDIAPVKALTDNQNTAAHDTTSQMEITPLAASFSNKGQLPFGGKAQRVPSVPSLDLHISEVCPPPPIQSPYRTQTPLSSPVELPTKPLWSDETETLLTPKLKNTTFFTGYVTLDMFDSGKHTTK